MPNKNAVEVTLTEIAVVSFAKSEKTNYDDWCKGSKRVLAHGHAVCFISRTGNQLCFVYKPVDLGKGENSKRPPRALLSVRLRLDSASRGWDPLMLQDYANALGLNIKGIQGFAKHYKAQQAAKGRPSK